MPTYEYECENCRHAFEEFQAMSDKPLRKCPKCGKLKLLRLIGAGAGIIFKGSGFYETDYKRKQRPNAGDADSKPAAQPEKTEKTGGAPLKPAAPSASESRAS